MASIEKNGKKASAVGVPATYDEPKKKATKAKAKK
tara:strand:+ start:1657 stop:1761 length:105 start_codon:yes stop_codon:yes gene_type:complete